VHAKLYVYTTAIMIDDIILKGASESDGIAQYIREIFRKDVGMAFQEVSLGWRHFECGEDRQRSVGR
jgi:hypothetical protein